MLRTVRVNPQTSTKDLQHDLAADGVTVHRSTIRCTLHKEMLHGRVMQRKPFLRPHHKQSHMSRLDYCNSLLAGINSSSISKLQMVQISAALLLTRTRSHDHITPVLQYLHWLPVKYRIQLKVLQLTYKALNDLTPPYLSDLPLPYKPSRSLRSSTAGLLTIPPSNLHGFGDEHFPDSLLDSGTLSHPWRRDGQLSRRRDGQLSRRRDGQLSRRRDGQLSRRRDGQLSRRRDRGLDRVLDRGVEQRLDRGLDKRRLDRRLDKRRLDRRLDKRRLDRRLDKRRLDRELDKRRLDRELEKRRLDMGLNK
ncbi:hypothetical protein NFI96_009983 [Prochilodus magdalenae]|nr:hypothetical protein NFI96_009983 [Prochilodus magdalenae]